MSERTAVIISCSQSEADMVREKAELQRRSMSAYMLNIIMRSVRTDESLMETHRRLVSWSSRIAKERPRTTMLIRCFVEEAAALRAAAVRRDISVSGYVLRTLHASREVAEGSPVQPAGKAEIEPGTMVRAVLPEGGIVSGQITSIVREEHATKFELEVEGQKVQRVYRWQIIEVR